MPDRELQWAIAWLSYCEKVRRTKRPVPQVDHLVAMTMGARLLTEQEAGNPVSLARLVSDVSPELITAPSAYRYIHDYAAAGIIEIEHISRTSKRVRLTPQGEVRVRGFLNYGIEAVEGAGWVYRGNDKK